MIRISSYGAALALLLLACGPREPAPAPEPPLHPGMSEAELAARFDAELQPLYERAMQSLGEAPEPVQAELLRTCDEWRHRDMPCDPWLVRRHQLECWIGQTEREMRHAYSLRLRNRPTQQKILRRQLVCMGDRGWLKHPPSAKP